MPILSWLTRDEDIGAASRVPYRLLQESTDLSAGDPDSGNILIQDDNLEALKALLPFYAGRVKCIYIDPPYNTGSAFEHYDDNLEHTQWLGMIWPRLVLLRDLLAEDGSIWINIDDNEAHYLKVAVDEVFGRKNFVANVVWQKRTSPDFRAVLGDGHDNVLVASKNVTLFREKANLLPLSERQKKEYKNPDNDPRGPWVSRDYSAQGYRPNQMYQIVTPGGARYYPPEGSCWKNVETVFLEQVKEGRFWFGKDGKGVPRRKNYLSEAKGRQSWTWWPNEEAGNTQESKRESIELFGKANVFDTPKPERLIERILRITTNPGDLVLDSFLGSGTIAAVAHKMGRRYIGIEMGEHAVTHCAPRLKKVIEGEQRRHFQERRLAGWRWVPILPARPSGVRREWADSTGCPLPRTGRARVVQRDQPAVDRRRCVAPSRSARRAGLRAALQWYLGRQASGQWERANPRHAASYP